MNGCTKSDQPEREFNDLLAWHQVVGMPFDTKANRTRVKSDHQAKADHALTPCKTMETDL
jgi:hypothetical protein